MKIKELTSELINIYDPYESKSKATHLKRGNSALPRAEFAGLSRSKKGRPRRRRAPSARARPTNGAPREKIIEPFKCRPLRSKA
ncbi:hypothetical protein EVAR_87577_1 [Eumeta japonica]|uniref:Uncharacterized protein n=1 Tax=Eumeta variegata TaxID=151549 RepID=A0A4C1WNU6_EUMVA|nr:hypothetical protein EVAR_87577_1 [Eumeta japonica]